MKCKNCGKEIKKEFRFCPYCGEEIETGFDLFSPFKKIFNIGFRDIDKEFEEIDKKFRSDFLKEPRFGDDFITRGGGISIVIRSGTGMQPKVSIKTSGDFKQLEPELKRKFGIREGVREVEGEEEVEKQETKVRRIPKVTEEPESEIKRLGDIITIEIKLPDVKSSNDIEIRKLGQSIEIKAFAKDKAYFKLLPIPENSLIRNKSFEHGVLRIELQSR
ncbi:MAG: zinc ribbon domain-containing protein [Candidatus Parvarchaeota archaeon]|nr:zinc ribbon domain-containing protein [Candidatus Jingweiarchaeum tengchongense]MCW1297910.1 zinc ribbon domain-containing protein [Candidatus Jingweiarchaeum tengchongense]MCW1300657.1 zinc ribbon domain-containing protein [Candidatus Jingweiarchaeum tengchongense]MCW1304651.1 zinc ribbon domain-containing protein [Candidatus Jingweiarchaeum tengchongense]MCW1306044.1 zinc ribbon domain-containing protein [Candidatus Jingweiarchaeum tengchongense]